MYKNIKPSVGNLAENWTHFPFDTYSMKTYVLSHFEHKNDVTIIIKLLYRVTSRRRVALSSLMMIVTSFLCSKCNRTYVFME